MPRTKVSLASVRVPVKRSRAEELKEKFDDLDNFLDTRKISEYSAAGAISPTDDIAYVDAGTALMAMTLANGTIPGETITIMLRSKGVGGSITITPATAPAGNDVITLDTAGELVQLVWVTTNGWTVRRTTGVAA